MCGCRTGRQPDPNRTSYDAYLYAFLIDVSLNASPLAFFSATCAPVRYVIYLEVRVALGFVCQWLVTVLQGPHAILPFVVASLYQTTCIIAWTETDAPHSDCAVTHIVTNQLVYMPFCLLTNACCVHCSISQYDASSPGISDQVLMLQEPFGSAAILHAVGSATKQLLQPGCAATQLWANQAFTGAITAAWVTLEVVQQAIVILLHDANTPGGTISTNLLSNRLLSSAYRKHVLCIICIILCVE